MKRVIFALLYQDGGFMLSRNFRLQRVGGLDWVLDNYDLARVSTGLDELMVLNVAGQPPTPEFADVVSRLAATCFIPVTAGGGIRAIEHAEELLRAGADKILINTALFDRPEVCARIIDTYGQQFVIAGVDAVEPEDGRFVVRHPTTEDLHGDVAGWLRAVVDEGAGEILLQSVPRDGTGMGIHTQLIDVVPAGLDVPLIVMGGVGRASHLIEALEHPTVDAVATANLFNFVADSFLDARRVIVNRGIAIPAWDPEDFATLRESLKD